MTNTRFTRQDLNKFISFLKDWNIRKHGFIYTDPMFLQELQSLLKRRGLTGISGVDYTEQGMQGTTYVSLYVGQRFVNSFDRKFSKM